MFGFRKKKKHHKAVNVPRFANNIICKGNNDIQIAENQNIEIFLEGENNQIVIAPRAEGYIEKFAFAFMAIIIGLRLVKIIFLKVCL